ncbi:DUF3800 domain-containing protein [Bacillus licheniformis]|uniref:DUF3800 domain-containing protein n=1 Tax=Bacillus glycinifermentans TaxID=1664069 RepID=A0A0T6BQY9_9BACI|nr:MULTISPECIES: DUF3800 domain-containing protein [Bacillus]KRT94036.1 hypothetical protein AB447_215435 [Bacillus glycinifermentans]MCM3436862.1 DUF3800 domain-containing protein [Bacillus licheniformis]MDE1440902.1 DUF3800 domain-containing protein [Bacillus licheniformis]MEC0487424.1 DUF3800 domain-containing protein [Bacillus glycinifermentans]
MFYIDESGSIPKFFSRKYKYRFFVIAFIHTTNPRKLRSTFKRAIGRLRKDFPDFFANLPNPDELKGSDTPPFMKLFILEKLFKATDIKIAHMVVCNQKIEQRFREQPARSFNYLVSIIMKNFPLSKEDELLLNLKIDNRNSALPSLNELEGYLYSDLVLDKQITKNVEVEYLQSDLSPNIQVADMISNIIFQYYRYQGAPFPNFNQVKKETDLVYHEGCEYLYNFLKPRLCTPFIFPPYEDAFAEVAATKIDP